MSAGTAASDPLPRYRAEFPALENSVYMVGHSLGAKPRATAAALREFADLWVGDGIVAWETWLPMVDEADEIVAFVAEVKAILAGR